MATCGLTNIIPIRLIAVYRPNGMKRFLIIRICMREFEFMGPCQKIAACIYFRCCTFMDSDVYSADAPWSIPTLLTVNMLALCDEVSPILTHPHKFNQFLSDIPGLLLPDNCFRQGKYVFHFLLLFLLLQWLCLLRDIYHLLVRLGPLIPRGLLQGGHVV